MIFRVDVRCIAQHTSLLKTKINACPLFCSFRKVCPVYIKVTAPKDGQRLVIGNILFSIALRIAIQVMQIATQY